MSNFYSRFFCRSKGAAGAGVSDDFSPGGMMLMLGAWGLWAMDPIVIHQIGQDVSRVFIAGFAALVAGLIFLPRAMNVFRRLGQLSKRHIALLLVQAVFFTAGAEFFYVSAVRYMNPGLVSAVLRTQVGFAVVFAMIFLGERLNRLSTAGICLIFLANAGLLMGAVFSGASGGASFTGWLLAFSAALLWSGATVSGKELLKVFRPSELLGVRMLLAGGCTLIFGLYVEGVQPLLNLTRSQWAMLALKGCLTTGLAFWLYYRGLNLMKVYLASALEPFAPLFTLLVARFFLDKAVSISDVASVAALLSGTALVIAGNYLSAKAGRLHRT